MAPIDIVVLAVIGIAFVAVCVRIYRRGTCADCAQGGVCTGHCSNKKTCAALKGVDKIAEDLGRGIKSGPDIQALRGHPFAGRFVHLRESTASRRVFLGYR